MPHSAANLAGWLNEPTVQDVVVAMLVEADCGLVLRDFVCTGGIPIASANRVLMRLHNRGLVRRYKLSMHRSIYSHALKGCIPDGARRMVFAYEWVGAEGECPCDDERGEDD